MALKFTLRVQAENDINCSLLKEVIFNRISKLLESVSGTSCYKVEVEEISNFHVEMDFEEEEEDEE